MKKGGRRRKEEGRRRDEGRRDKDRGKKEVSLIFMDFHRFSRIS